ncbi:hypothetical protein I317_06814 [Kwoniella heveanensis CBS 569]|uniref:Amidase domain-containing protein n=1 Tax=Kwoniella heveanensis BCC8398 TaxID=1296120 RepID=A0A1B9GNA9_9TREE|nr:hypothetical protein I316_05915 [Kwoniella heveanensis BCC8398]OCF39386.1 hypothetical protein I317_06814 [Kwoniella heveanensis CBS 569]
MTLVANMEPCFLTATEAAKLMRAGKLSVEEMAKSTLARVEARDDAVKGWAYFDKELVLQRAKELDSVPLNKRGPLFGVPVAVKDVIYTRDMPTQHNSPIYEGHAPEIDAACIMTLRAAGALIFGKAQTTEFAATTRSTPARNPYDSNRTPGGSSSGSGAVVGDFQSAIGLGTQTIGSTIRPGSFNNIFAMKPTWNAISREGLKMLAASLDTLGLYGRSADDLDLLCDVFHIQDDEPPVNKPIHELTIAVCKSPIWKDASNVTSSLAQVWTQAIGLLEQAGVKVVELELPTEFDGVFDASRNIMWTEARSAFLNDYLNSPDKCHDDFKSHVENRRNLSRKDQLAAYDLIGRLKPIFDDIASEYDAILTPSTTGEAPAGLESTGSAIFCGTWTGLQVPVINVPGFAGENGMPIGLSLVTGRYKDRKLVAVAKQVAKVFHQAHGGKIKSLPGVPSALL